MLRILWALALVAVVAIPAFGQSTVPLPAARLADLTAEALRRSPAVAAARAEVEARRAMESPAGALPDPMLEAVLQNVSFKPTVGKDENSLLGIEASQGLPYPGKRAAARAMAAGETTQAAATLAALERQVVAEVATLYAQIYALDRERETLTAATELIDLLEQIAHSRYAAGEGDQEGILKIQIERLRNSEKLGDLANLRHSTVAGLNRWLDRPGDEHFEPVAALPEALPITADTAEAEIRAVAHSAEVARAAAAVRVAERRVKVARLDLKPNFSAGAGISSRGGLEPVLVARFGVELPFWRRQKQLPLLSAAGWQLEAARRELADAQATARSEAAHQVSAWTNAERQATLYREGILPETSFALDAARSSYLNGRGTFSTVIEDFELWLDARVALARRDADRFMARVEFDRLVGTGETASPAPSADTLEEQR
ncbi:MAG: TolC family protein [Acidobacteriota bacterium]